MYVWRCVFVFIAQDLVERLAKSQRTAELERAHTWPSWPVPCRSMNVPPPLPDTLELPDPRSATCIFTCMFFILERHCSVALWYSRSKRRSVWIFPLLFIWTLCAALCLNLRRILHKQSQWCRCSMPVLVHVHPYKGSKVHLFQQCQGRRCVPCLGTVQSPYTSQTTRTLRVKPV